MRRRGYPLPFSGLMVALLLAVLQVTAPSSVCAANGAEERESRMGREAQKEVEQSAKLCTDKAMIARVDRLGQAIAAVANSTPVDAKYGDSGIAQFKYEFKVIEDRSVNAFSLPGGLIYVNTGLLDYVQSDHELAGVLAHEVAHASHHHMVHLLREQNKLDSKIALLLLAGMLARMDGQDLGNLLIGAQLFRTAKSSGYGQKAEADADISAVAYMEKAGYNPVGMLTFLERLCRDASRNTEVDLGILQTHPAAKDRCRSVLACIQSLGVPVNRRAVTRSLTAVVGSATVKGQSIAQIRLGDDVLFEPAPLRDAASSEQRAQVIAAKVNQFLDAEPKLREVRLSPDHRSILLKGQPVIVVTAQDGDMYDRPADQVAAQAVNTLRQAIWRDTLNQMY